MSQQVYSSPSYLPNRPAYQTYFADQRLLALEAKIPPGPGTPGAVAFFDGSGVLSSSNISVTGTNDDLTFVNNKTIFVDNIESTDGDLNLGGGVTNLLTLNSSNQVTIDATNNIRIGHTGLAVDVLDYLTAFAVTTTEIESLTALAIGGGTTDVTLDALTNLTIGHAGGTVNLLSSIGTASIDHLTCLDINSAATLTIGGTTPTLLLDAATAMTISHPGVVVVIDDSVEVDNIDTINIDSSTPNLNVGVNTTTVLVDGATTLELGHIGGSISVIGAVTSPNILSLDATSSVVIGNSTATAVSIAHAGIVTTIQDRVDCLGGVRSNFVESATGGSMSIGNAAAGLGLSPSSGVIRVDQLSTGAAINIGNATATAINLGRIGINATAKGEFVLDNTLLFNQAGATALAFYSEVVYPNVTATGPDASQVVGNLAVQKVGNTVSILFDWTVAPIVTVPATAIITFDVALDPIYRPANLQKFICGVNVNTGYAQGKFSISAAGVMTMYPASGAWLIGEGASSDSVCVSYNIAI